MFEVQLLVSHLLLQPSSRQALVHHNIPCNHIRIIRTYGLPTAPSLCHSILVGDCISVKWTLTKQLPPYSPYLLVTEEVSTLDKGVKSLTTDVDLLNKEKNEWRSKHVDARRTAAAAQDIERVLRRLSNDLDGGCITQLGDFRKFLSDDSPVSQSCEAERTFLLIKVRSLESSDCIVRGAIREFSSCSQGAPHIHRRPEARFGRHLAS